MEQNQLLQMLQQYMRIPNSNTGTPGSTTDSPYGKDMKQVMPQQGPYGNATGFGRIPDGTMGPLYGSQPSDARTSDRPPGYVPTMGMSQMSAAPMGMSQSMNPGMAQESGMLSSQLPPEQLAQIRAQYQAQQQQNIQAQMEALRAQHGQSFWKQPGYQGQEQARMASNAQAMQQRAAAEQANGYRQGMPLNTPSWRQDTAQGQAWSQSPASSQWRAQHDALRQTPDFQRWLRENPNGRSGY